jgi:hypothetical protein
VTTPEQFGQDSADLMAIISFGWLAVIAVIAVTWWLERRARRREPEVLPPPIDGRDHNAESIAAWQRKVARIDRSEVIRGDIP